MAKFCLTNPAGRRPRLVPVLIVCLAVLGSAAGGAWAADEYEPDDSAAAARPIEANEVQDRRSIDPADDVDWVRFSLEEPAKVLLQADHPFVAGADALITLMDSAEGVLASGTGTVSAFLDAGDYLASIEDDGRDAVIPDYTLVLSVIDAAGDMHEPNDTPEEAIPMELGDSLAGLTVAPVGDVDWVVFALDEPAPVAIDAVVALGSVRVTVFDSDLDELDSGGTRVFPDLEAGTYYVRVEEDGNNDLTAAYTLNLWRRDGPDPYEVDDTPAAASWIGSSGPKQTHNFHAEGDEDWVRFFANEGNTIACEAVGIGPLAQPQLSLFEDDGETVIRDEQDFISWTAPATGFYLVRVRNANGAFGPDTVYTIGIPLAPTGIIPGTLLGTVVSLDSGQPIPGAIVEIVNFGNFTGTTDHLGVYLFPALPSGVYSVRARAVGHRDSGTEVVRIGSGSTLRNIGLDPEPPRAPADINGDSLVNSLDIQLAINAVLGIDIGAFDADVNGDSQVNAQDIQLVINAVLGIAPGGR